MPADGQRTIQLPASGSWKAAIVADTHSKPHPRIEELLRERAPDLVFHAGDIGELEVLDQLAKIAPTIAVRGNIDVHAPNIPDAMVVDLLRGGQLGLRIFLTHIAVYGPRLRSDIKKRAKAAGARVVLCGHSHVPFLKRDGELTVFNPGSIGPRRFQLPITFGMMTIAESRLALEHVDCETGLNWLPPAAPVIEPKANSTASRGSRSKVR